MNNETWIDTPELLKKDDFKDPSMRQYWVEELTNIKYNTTLLSKQRIALKLLDYIDDFKNRYVREEVEGDLRSLFTDEAKRMYGRDSKKTTYIVKAKSYKDAVSKVKKARNTKDSFQLRIISNDFGVAYFKEGYTIENLESDARDGEDVYLEYKYGNKGERKHFWQSAKKLLNDINSGKAKLF